MNNNNKIKNETVSCPVCKTDNEQNLTQCKECGFTLQYIKGYHIDISESEAKEYRKKLERAKVQYHKIKKVEQSDVSFNAKKQNQKSKDSTEKNYKILSKELLKKDVFTKSKDNRKRIQNLGFVKIGWVEFVDYNAEKEILTIVCKQKNLDEIELNYIIDNQNISLNMSSSQAKKLFNQNQKYDLLAKIDYDEHIVIIKELVFINYSLLDIIKKEQQIDRLSNMLGSGFNRIKNLLLKSYTNSVWKDQDTGLIWQVEIENKGFTWNEAFEYAKKLNIQNYGGYSDWRVPSIRELKTIMTEEGYENPKSYSGKTYIKKPLLESMNMKNQWFWSTDYSSGAWLVNFNFGVDEYYDKSNDYYVRCVVGRQ